MDQTSTGQGSVSRQNSDAVKLTQTLTIAKRIGRGRLGAVYAAVHEVLARRFAVKVLRPPLTADERVRHRLRHMVREASQVEHPGVVSLVDFGQLPDGRFYLTMEYVRGIQLSRLLQREGRLPTDRVVPILIDLADALHAIHRRRVIHGDIKPNNVTIVEASGEGVCEAMRIHDLMLAPALASPSEQGEAFAHLKTHGTVAYLSPEQLARRTSIDGRADMYSFGALAYQMLTGQPPFLGEPERVVEAHLTRDPVPPSRRSGADDVPRALDALLLRCLEKEPGDRYASMDEVMCALRSMGERVSGTSMGPSPASSYDDELHADDAEEEEPLPEAPGRLRRLLYETVAELSEHIIELGAADEDMVEHLRGLKTFRKEADMLASQIGFTENRFEDIRRELREGESALRYAIIDLNLAKSEMDGQEGKEEELAAIGQQIAQLERSLSELEKQRSGRFESLNTELTQSRERFKELEHQMALRYRWIYGDLDRRRAIVRTDRARLLFRRLERGRNALAKKAPGRAG